LVIGQCRNRVREGMVAIPIVDMIDMPRFIEQRRKNADQ
jgi:hypothetical protein